MLCPHCNQALQTRKVEGEAATLEYCGLCKAAWFDKGELARLLGRSPESAVTIPDNPIRLDKTHCPKCEVPLFMFAYPETGRVIEGCGECGGIWIDREDLAEIRSLPAPARESEVAAAPQISAREEAAPEPQRESDAPAEPKTRPRTDSPPVIETRRIEPPRPTVVRERVRYSDKYGLAFSRLLLQTSSLRIDQEIPGWAETRLRLVVPNSYRIRSLRGSTLGWAEEQGNGLRALIRRSVQRDERSFEIRVLGAAKRETILSIHGKEGMLRVSAGEDLLGTVSREGEGPPHGWTLTTADGAPFASVHFAERPEGDGATPGDWEFPLELPGESGRAGLVTKKWAGTWKETTTDSDNFRVDYGTTRWTPEQRAVIFSAVFAIDFDLFEDDNPADGPGPKG